MIAISMDLDWASDEVLRDSLSLLQAAGARATFFLTHRPDVSLDGHETAIHPHFATLDLEGHLRERLTLFPGAVGTRSHALFDTYRLQTHYAQVGIRYQSNVVQYLQAGLRPYAISPWVTEVPIFFMDNIDILMRGSSGASRIADLGLERPGLKVFDFHPIHVFLNTDSLERYEAAKPYQRDIERLSRMRNSSGYGVRDLFVSLLEHVKRSSGQWPLLSEVAGGTH